MTARPFATPHLNRIGTAVPAHDVHAAYIAYACEHLATPRQSRSLERLLARAQIDHRYAIVPFDFYGAALPDTATRMHAYEERALDLAFSAVEALGIAQARRATHLIVTTCTGFYAPGIDLQIIERFGLRAGVERTIVGFMGCYAAMNALKLARHIVRSEDAAVVLIVNLEICSLHLQRPRDVEQALGFAIFADGCAASIVSAEPVGLALESFASTLVPDSGGDITWRIGGLGFDMRLSLEVPRKIGAALRADAERLLGGLAPAGIDLWAVHPGGRAVLDAVEDALALAPGALASSRDVLRRFGNMSSATISFVLARVLDGVAAGGGGTGCAIAFGPGMICETMRFSAAT